MTIQAGLISFNLWALSIKANAGAGAPTHDPAFAWSLAYADGQGAGQFELVYDKVHSLNSLSVNTFELKTLTDPFGTALSFDIIKALCIYNDGSVAISVGGGLGFACPSIPAGGIMAWATGDASGLTIGANPNDELVITNGNAAGSVRLIICGH